MSVVVVGAGHAAGQLSASLRQNGYKEPISLIGQESHIPYQRPPLSKTYLKDEVGLERVVLRPEAFYEKQDIKVRTNTAVTAIDRTSKVVVCEQHETIPYETLVLATGTRPIILDLPGIDSKGVHVLRRLEDVESIKSELHSVQHAILIGGGYIGLEVAASLTELGQKVTIIELEDRILKRVTTPEMSKFYHDLHISRGVDIKTNTKVVEIIADENVAVSALRLDSGEQLEADIVVVGVGVVPNTEIAAAANLPIDNGIVVDEFCRTADPNIFAIGDCTNHPNPLLNRRLRLESVPNAMDQSRTAALNIAGKQTSYAAYPWFWSDQYDLKLQMAGFTDDFDEQVIRGTIDERQFTRFYLKQGKLIAANAVNSPREFMAARQMLGKEISARSLGDSKIELRTLLG